MTEQIKEEPLKVPTNEDIEKKREDEADALFPKEYPIKIGDKTIWVEELAMKDMIKLQKVYLKILKQGYKIYQQFGNPTDEENVNQLLNVVDKDLETITNNDLEFLMIALRPSNPDLTKEDLLNLKPSQSRILFNKILEINGISDALKKTLPSDLKDLL